MRSTSNLTIEWVKPDIATEQWEFAHHPDKQGFYLRHNIGWSQILAGFDAGRLVAYPRSDRIDGCRLSSPTAAMTTMPAIWPRPGATAETIP